MRIDDENLRKSSSPFREYRSFPIVRGRGERERERKRGKRRKKKNRSRIDVHYDSCNRNCRNCVAVLRSLNVSRITKERQRPLRIIVVERYSRYPRGKKRTRRFPVSNLVGWIDAP